MLGLRDVTFGFGEPPIVEGATLQIDPGERLGLLGRNGAGKTTLMRLIHGQIEPSEGEIIRQQGLRTALLTQDVPARLDGTVFDEVARGLGRQGQLLADYHHASLALATEGGPKWQAELDRLGHELDVNGGWDAQRNVERVLSQTGLDADAQVGVLSAGLRRRVLLAKALAGRPDILLLDEPTNHLDIASVAWLEEFLLRYDGTLVFVTHDRMLLRKLATRILDLDRGRLTSWACDYTTYLNRKAIALEAEARQEALFDKKLAQEETWIRRGILARRTRNEGRVRALIQMRRERAQRRQRPGEAKMQVQEAGRSGRLVLEAKDVHFAYVDRPLIDGLSTLIMRGDRVGVIGPNGSGKTTLLRLLLGKLSPNHGALRHGTNLEVAYFDQLQEQLDGETSVRDNLADGADSIEINGQRRHVMGYLRDFLFTDEQARMPAKYLSGGEHNRLLLARLLARPSNLLVLDEPTNDLDIETLELLEELLMDYPGTLLLVSHDREFLNNVVTSTLVLEGDGQIREYAGGYDDWLTQRGPVTSPPLPDTPPKKEKKKPSRPVSSDRPARLTYKEQRELESLPERIEQLEARLAEHHTAMSSPDFFRLSGEQIAQQKRALTALETELKETYARWESLEQRSDK
ncbi:MAG: ATP-binding cassette domain-containing protein [Pirellulales bacterium]|nr:ATP-binding cassette domain-containing protein [Pirellulales bacterium]